MCKRLTIDESRFKRVFGCSSYDSFNFERFEAFQSKKLRGKIKLSRRRVVL